MLVHAEKVATSVKIICEIPYAAVHLIEKHDSQNSASFLSIKLAHLIGMALGTAFG